jgi:asparagine synthase (glutamine-hydrolysing)
MIASLGHRGPDAAASGNADGCAFGHARLSIIDLVTGAQPMTDVSGRFSITFNGEIYNYRELKRRLEREGAAFRTASDTEVILEGYRAWGARVLSELRGMFAFAIWDREERALFAARDLFGEKPLYYSHLAGGGLVMASEIRAILASGLVAPALNRATVDACLALGYVPPTVTVYANVATLPPAHTLRWRDGSIEVSRYWRPHFRGASIDLAEAAGEVRRLLTQAVERQMVADVPVGAFLSGGADSSTIVALMQRGRTGPPVQTFSVGFGREINELPYARAVAKQYGTDHHELDLGEPQVAALLERMADVYDEPFADSSHIPTFAISGFARQFVKVVLSGDGGDEMFGGYGRYTALAESESLKGSLVEWVALRALSRLLRERIAPLHRRSVGVGLAYRWSDVAVRCAMSQVNIAASERRRLWGGPLPAADGGADGWGARPAEGVTGLNRAFAFDIDCYLPGDILVKVDRASMAHGLETRAPFLDRDLAEFVLALPPALKVAGDRTKIVLREAVQDLWPEAIRRRGKQGFGAPYARWMGRSDVQAIAKRVFGAGAPLRALLPGVPPDPAPTYRSWTLMTLGLWLEKHACAW